MDLKRDRYFVPAATALLLLTALLSACARKEAENVTAAPTPRTVTDMTGRVVTVPATVERVITAFGPSYETVFILGGKDKIVATGAMHAKRRMAVKINPDLVNYPAITALGMSPDLNIEEMIKIQPDIVFFWPNEPVLKKLEEAGIPGIVFYSFSVPESFQAYKDQQKGEIRFIGELLGGQSPAIAEAYCAYYDEKLDYLYGRTSGLGEERRPRVYIGNSTGSNILNGWAKNMEENYMDWIAGGASMTAKAEQTSAGGFTQITKEELIAWNPEYIIVDNHGGNTQAIRDGVLTDPSLATVDAVRNGRVYTVPIGVFLMNHCAEKPLYMLWLAKTIQPQLFSDLDFNREMKRFYEKFYGYQLSDEEIEQILKGE